ncbi:MAG: TlpA family protein disulfide reductase [Actinobacteria bacterium]|nr:TlpA family protein disulfide reductase [Actinomycetota bacterium]
MTGNRCEGARAPEPGVRQGIVRRAGFFLVVAGLVIGGVYVVWDLALAREPDHSSASRPVVAAGAPRPSVGRAPLGSRPGETAPDFAIPTADGGTFRLSSYRGRTVVVDFLAQGCVSCTAEIATLTKTWEALKGQGLVVLVVDDSGMSPQQAANYYRSLGGGDMAYGEDVGFRVAQSYGVIDVSTTVVIDPSGKVTFRDSGFTSRATLQAAVGRSLA